MKKTTTTYSIEAVKEKMEKYLDASEERLRSRLRQAWKKQATKIKAYDRFKV
jgi:N-methylhydantoinase B/oxoprolinase/acetone carboxylase alpha subunit